MNDTEEYAMRIDSYDNKIIKIIIVIVVEYDMFINNLDVIIQKLHLYSNF